MTEELTTGASANADNAAANENNGAGNDTQTSLQTQSQNTGNDWHTQLSEEYRNHPSIQKFSDVNGKTGPYLLYTAVRIKKLLENTNYKEEINNNSKAGREEPTVCRFVIGIGIVAYKCPSAYKHNG